MKLFTNKNPIYSYVGKDLLLDNDFLSDLYRNEIILSEFLLSFNQNTFIVDPLTEFEFLRDVFEPRQRRIKESFLAKPIFLVPNKEEGLFQLKENALLLSKIYSHRGHTKNTKISMVDLFLGARCMLNPDATMILTGNKRDFPNSVFDIVTIINSEQNDGSIKSYSVLKFIKEKFNECFKKIEKMEAKYDKLLEDKK